MQAYIQIISFQGIFIILKQFQMSISNQRGQQKMKKKEHQHQTQSEGYGLTASPNREVNQFQSSSVPMTEWDLMKAQESKLQKDCKDIEEDIQKTEKDIVNLRQKYKSQEEQARQLGLQKTRTENLIKSIKCENQRLEKKEAICNEDIKDIQKEIQMAYQMQINSIETNFKQVYDSKISKVFEEYFPLYESLQSSEGTLYRTLNTAEKKSKILAWVNVEKQKRSLLNLLKEKKVQQFRLQYKLKNVKNEDKEEIEVEIYKVSLDIKDLENQLKEPQNKNIVKSEIQIKYQNLEMQRLQMEQFDKDQKQKAVDQRQKSLIRLAECISFGNNVILTNGQNIKSTSFFKQYRKIPYYENRLSQIYKYLQSRRQQLLKIQMQENKLKKCKQDYQKNQNELRQVEDRVKYYKSFASSWHKLRRVNTLPGSYRSKHPDQYPPCPPYPPYRPHKK